MDLDDQSPDDQAAGSSLRDAALKGVRWMAIGRFIVEIGTLLSSVALARLVRPDEFGAVPPTALLIAVGGTLSTGSFGTPLVRAEVLTRKLVQTALALSLLTGAAVSALIIVGAQVIDLGYTEHQVHLIQVVAPTFFLFSIGAVSQALIERELDFRRSALNEVGSILPSTIATVIMAAMGLQGLALAIGYLVMAGCSSLQAIWWKPPPLPWIQAGKIREIVGFGLFASGSSILYAMQRTIGYGILGARLNATSAGYYYRATQLGVEYQAKVTQILLRMLFPLLSRAETPEQMRSVRARMVQVHTAFLFPLLAMLVVLAPVLVPWLYGSEWAGASEATQILAIVGFATVVNTGTGPVLLAAGRPRALLVKDGIELPALIAVLVIAAPHGLITACWAVAAFRLVSLVANQYFLLDRICGIPIKDTLVRDVVPAATASAIAAGAAGARRHGGDVDRRAVRLRGRDAAAVRADLGGLHGGAAAPAPGLPSACRGRRHAADAGPRPGYRAVRRAMFGRQAPC
jgi:O-antigen/teichoic acid export membrane protein